jgi:hypothetical protein
MSSLSGYGSDIWCTDTLVTGRLATGRTLVAQALYRRLITPRGMLADDGTYGLDLAGYVGAVGTTVALAALPSLVRAELLKDDRVSDVSVTSAISTDRAGLVSIVLEIGAVLSDESESFALTVGVSGAGTVLLGSAP